MTKLLSAAEVAERLSDLPPKDEVLTAREAAAFLRISLNKLYEAAGRMEVPHQKIGGTYRFSREALIRWLGSCGVQKG